MAFGLQEEILKVKSTNTVSLKAEVQLLSMAAKLLLMVSASLEVWSFPWKSQLEHVHIKLATFENCFLLCVDEEQNTGGLWSNCQLRGKRKLFLSFWLGVSSM